MVRQKTEYVFTQSYQKIKKITKTIWTNVFFFQIKDSNRKNPVSDWEKIDENPGTIELYYLFEISVGNISKKLGKLMR